MYLENVPIKQSKQYFDMIDLIVQQQLTNYKDEFKYRIYELPIK